jgi:hypothetical protein
MTFPQGTLPRLIQVALAEVGTIETGNNETKYGKFMKADKLPWCGSFLNWCADQAGVKVPNVVSTKAGAEAFRKRKQWHSTPKIGDFVFFDFIIDDKETINHIGLGDSPFRKTDCHHRRQHIRRIGKPAQWWRSHGQIKSFGSKVICGRLRPA